MTFQGGTFTVTLTDSNNVLSNFVFTSTNSALRFNAAGNKLTISSSSAISGATVNVTRKNAVSASSTITAYAGSGLQETIIGIEATGNTSGYFSVNAEPEAPPSPSPGNVKIIKTSDDGYVQGIYFTLSGMGKNLSGTTNASGYLTASNLEPGTYTVTESVPSDYTADKNPQTVTVNSGETATVYFHNSIKKSSFKIVKTSDDGAVSGIQFTITGPGVSKTVTTGADGTITVPDLPAGKYTITEQVPDGYTSDNASQQVTIMPGEFYPLYFHNTPELGEIKIVKTSDDGKVSRIQFRITGGETTKVGTTGADGTLPFRNLKPGTYTVTEVVPAGYTADHQSQVVTVKAGETATVNFHNTRKTGEIVIHKESEDGVVSGIPFRVQGEGIDQNVTTGSDGTISVPGLTPGEYTVTEIVPEGYVSDNASQTVTVGSDSPVSVYFKNTPKQWRVSVTKVDAEPNVRRSTRITLEGAQYGVYKDGTLRDTYTTDANGQFTTNYYACGTGWTLQEIKAPPGYTVDSTSYSIGLAPGSAQLAINETELTVPEEIIKGKLLITKQDAGTQTPLAGAVFTVYDETGATVTEATTGEDGTATVEELPYGKYTAKETTAPEGYLLDDSVFDFSIETDGQEVQLTRDNYPAIGSITVHKADTQGNTLAGATYLLEWSQDGGLWQPVTFRDSTTAIAGGCTSLGLENGQLTTGADGTVKFDGLLADKKVQYRLTETKAPEGLSLLKDPVFQGTLPFDAATGPLYDIAYTVTNNRITTLPQTGSTGLLLPVTVGTALLGLAGCAGFFVVRSRKKSKSN